MKKLIFITLILFGCNKVANVDIQDQHGKKHFYNRILHFNEASTMLWCNNHEKFEVVKKDTNRPR